MRRLPIYLGAYECRCQKSTLGVESFFYLTILFLETGSISGLELANFLVSPRDPLSPPPQHCEAHTHTAVPGFLKCRFVVLDSG